MTKKGFRGRSQLFEILPQLRLVRRSREAGWGDLDSEILAKLSLSNATLRAGFPIPRKRTRVLVSNTQPEGKFAGSEQRRHTKCDFPCP